jgi:RNA 2',3'-cyclic 3'-phosphodiesterase
MPRLFTALEVPRQIASGLTLLKGGLHGSRWVDAENYHVTLRFIGDIDPRQADELAEALDHILAPQIDIKVSGLSVFGSKKPRALIALIEPHPVLTALNSDMEHLCRKLGLAIEPRNFVPHITLAHLKNTAPEEVALYLTQRGLVSVPVFSATRFVLMSSRDSVGGGPYAIEAVYPLQRTPPNGLPQNSTLSL